MGGSGSTRWDGHRKRRSVENCQCMSIRDLKEAGILWSSKPEWRWEGILPEPEEWRDCTIPGCEDCRPMVYVPFWDEYAHVEAWHPRFGGISWWFRCSKCDCRCLKLYRPYGQRWFYCRRCWELAYESSQDAHRWDRGIAAAFLAPLYATCGVSMREVERMMRADFKAQRVEDRARR